MNLETIRNNKLYIGPMSLNVVDAVLENDIPNVGFIPSRRQVEYDGGYVNNWTTKSFSEYVKGRVVIERDHGGPGQGKDANSNCYVSFEHDARYFNIIHIDPWKVYQDIYAVAYNTAEFIRYCDTINPNLLYEIGTEEAICRIEVAELEKFVHLLSKHLKSDLFKKIAYLVIQSGTALQGDSNTGVYDADRLKYMLQVCKYYNLMSKEHNGDFLSAAAIKERFDLGLSAINIAPEFGQIETQYYVDYFKKHGAEKLETMFDLCLKSDKWRKWVSKDFNPHDNKEKLIKITGHYIFSNPEFQKIVPDDKYGIKDAIKRRIYEIIS